MPTPANDASLNNAIKAYLEGANVVQAARAHGLGSGRLSSELKHRNLMRPIGHGHSTAVASRMGRIPIPLDEMISLYRSGVSEKALAERYGTSRNVIAARLRRGGVERRNRSAAQQHRIDAMGDTEIGLLVRNMHIAAEAAGEDTLTKLLAERGHVTIAQLPTGRYNIDHAIPPVAMEVHARRWSPLHATIRRGYERQRIKNLTDWGWHVHYIWSPEGIITHAAADDAVAFLERTKGLPSAPGQYRVVRGSGELVAEGCGDLD